MSNVQRMWWHARPFAEEADEAKLADAGRRGELVETDLVV